MTQSNALNAYREEYGHLYVPQHYPLNRRLGKWVNTQKSAGYGKRKVE